MIFYMLLACMTPPTALSNPSDCFVLAASPDHDKAKSLARQWCAGDQDCLERTYLQQVRFEPSFEKIK